MKQLSSYTPLYIMVVLVLIAGMYFPKLMDYDAAEYAGIAMHMEQQNNYAEIINRTYPDGQPYDYLDKPHVLFWSAWPGFKLFGVSDMGYRFVSILMSLLAAFATTKLGSLLYNKRVGAMAGLFFISSQAIILANHDVRTDSLLTSFVVLAVWQIVRYINTKNLWALVWGGAFLAGGVGTKGMIAVLVAGCVVFFYLLGKKDWKTIFNWRWLVMVASFFLFLSPVMYFYYLQFDLHPEKMVNGTTGMSGIKFLLWTQSFERFAGDRTFVDNPEFSFFFHSILWALLPWSILFYAATFHRLKGIWVSKSKSFFGLEQLTFAGAWAMFLIMSKSSFKLPHYLNVLFPFMCVLTAGYLYHLFESHQTRVLQAFRKMQWGIIILLGVLLLVLCWWAFPITDPGIIILVVLLFFVCLGIGKLATNDILDKVWVPSALAILLVNIVLNMHFYPAIDEYQGGSKMAEYIEQNNIDSSRVFIYNETIRSFDFYMKDWRPMLSDDEIKAKLVQNDTILLFTHDKGLEVLQQSFEFEEIHRVPDFHITGLNAKFLNPKTRAQSHGFMHLVRVLQ